MLLDVKLRVCEKIIISDQQPEPIVKN